MSNMVLFSFPCDIAIVYFWLHRCNFSSIFSWFFLPLISFQIVFPCIFTETDDSLGEQPQFVYDDTGKITGYTTKIGGADTVFPFSSGITIPAVTFSPESNGTNAKCTYTIDTKDYNTLTPSGITTSAYVNNISSSIVSNEDIKLGTVNSNSIDISSCDSVTITVTGQFYHYWQTLTINPIKLV